MDAQNLKLAALGVVHDALREPGILATAAAPTDNYARVWSRDAMMTGIAAGILADDPLALAGLRASILTLARHQGPQGQIASNVGVQPGEAAKVSYGGLAGRTDATTWWLVGTALYLAHQPEPDLQAQLAPQVERALEVLNAWEFNGRGLVYVPLGGNWADEYVVQAYTLYDNLLRLWALEAAAAVWRRSDWAQQAGALRQLLAHNYRHHPSTPEPAHLYHPAAYARAEPRPYWWCGLAPHGYDTRWDMGANALALLLGLGTPDDWAGIQAYVAGLAHDVGHWLLPVFWPVIEPHDPDWRLLTDNHSYRFKNEPYHFHNAGAWPIFLGWLGLGLAATGATHQAHLLLAELQTALAGESPAPATFREYWNPRTRQPGGVARLCYSASGYLLLTLAADPVHWPARLARLRPA